tara:strand:- start:111 stop:671 length:561 start_codon:yes stop_codon:yes gene_type:complete
MNNQTSQNSIKHWYLPLCYGFLFIGIGIYSLTYPIDLLVTLSFFLGLSFLISGVSEIIFSLFNKNEMVNWGLTFIIGLITFFIGILLMNHPEIPLATLSLYIGFLILFRSIGSITYSIVIKKNEVFDWGYFLLGILGIIFSILLIKNPSFIGMSIVILTGISLITVGLFNIYLSFKLKKMNSISNE